MSEMSAGFFVRGLAVGFSIAAPVGPIGVLCIRRTLAQGRTIGFASGLGAATADAAYGCVAAFGLSSISGFLVGQQMILRLLGGLFLIYLGARTFAAKPAADRSIRESNSLALTGAFASTLALTLTNPMTILSFGFIFAGFGFGTNDADLAAAAVMVLGVFVGSAFWWLLLSGGVGLVREKFDLRSMQWVNRISGAVIGGFGLLALIKSKP